MNDDDRLHAAFAELRKAEASRVPEFRELLGRRGGRPYTSYFRFAFATMLVILVLGSLAPLLREPEPPQPSISSWRAPTDFLLQTPGKELVDSVPDLKGETQ